MNLPELQKHIVPLSYRGRERDLSRIWLKNLFWGMATLGTYWIHGRVHTRRYVWAHVYIGEMPLTWVGQSADQKSIRSPQERALCLAFFIRVLTVVLGAIGCLPGLFWEQFIALVRGLLTCITYPLFQLVNYRFQLSHTHFRHIAFGHEGRLGAYVKLYATHAAWAVLTLGLGYAEFAVATRHYTVTQARYGDVMAQYTGVASELRRTYVIGTLACVLTLGAYLPWHIAKLRNYHLNRTALGPLKLVSTQEGSTLSNLWALNLLIMLGTLGLGYAIVRTRGMRYQLGHLAIEGDLDALGVNPKAPQHFGGLVDLLSFGGDSMLGA